MLADIQRGQIAAAKHAPPGEIAFHSADHAGDWMFSVIEHNDPHDFGTAGQEAAGEVIQAIIGFSAISQTLIKI